MEERSRSPSHDMYSILGLGCFSKVYKALVSRCHHEKNSSSKKAVPKDEPKSTREEYKAHEHSYYNHENKNENMHEFRYNGEGSPRGIFKSQNHENNYFARSPLSSPPLSRSTTPLRPRNQSRLRSRSISPSPLSRSESKRSQTPLSTGRSSLLRTMSRRSSADSAFTTPGSLSRNASRRSATPIMYSNSNGVIKPPAIEETFECTLEELCFGCTKKIKIIRDAVTDDGNIIVEDEVLTIKVKPGWKKGTKITFEGMGNEMPGALPADVIFTITEKRHHLYRREGEDLELAVKIPLVEALTGCTVPIPLLGGEKMTLTMDDIIYPGYKKIIAGQGMAKPQEQGKRGNLIIEFLVQFPVELTDEQRSDVVNILEDSF